MRKQVCAMFALMALVLALPAPAFAAANAATKSVDLSYLKSWDKRYPTVAEDLVTFYPRDKTFFADPNVKEVLVRTLGEARYQQVLTGWQTGKGPTTHPIGMLKDGLMVIFGCRQHMCDSQQYNIFLDIQKGVAQVCWRDQDLADKADQWINAAGEAKSLSRRECVDNTYAVLFNKYGAAPEVLKK